jgi:ornithine cyclodeaminase/alanine dehydrogenase-like protein (mu-crystallin family)
MSRRLVRILTEGDVAALLDPNDCLVAVEEAFRQHAAGRAPPPGVLGVRGTDGGFHIKAGLLDLGRRYFAAKVNGNFAGNAERGLPRIQGVIVLSDGDDGSPLAILGSAEVTRLRTAAATALAARLLARADASVVTMCGCGAQAPAQLVALARVRPLRQVFAFDRDAERARSFAREQGARLGVAIVPTDDLRAAAQKSAIVVTCTPSREPILFGDFLAAGTFVAAVGADSSEKQELAPELLAAATVVTDVTEQCATIGDLHHALAGGQMSRNDVYAELGEVVAGKKLGRRSEDEIIVFDSTGMALQDVAAAAAAFERAEVTSRGLTVDFGP